MTEWECNLCMHRAFHAVQAQNDRHHQLFCSLPASQLHPRTFTGSPEADAPLAVGGCCAGGASSLDQPAAGLAGRPSGSRHDRRSGLHVLPSSLGCLTGFLRPEGHQRHG
jgi:hypothetical protein